MLDWTLDRLHASLSSEQLTALDLGAARFLRDRYQERWLVALLQAGDEREELAIACAIEETICSLAGQGSLPPWPQIARAARAWARRYVKQKAAEWEELVRLTDTIGQERAGQEGVDANAFITMSAARSQAMAQAIVRKLEGEQRFGVATPAEMLELARHLVKEVLGAGGLEELLEQGHLYSEIMVFSSEQDPEVCEVWVEERGGRKRPAGMRIPLKRAKWFLDQVAGEIGGRIDRSATIMDGYLNGGRRIHGVIGPTAADGISICVRLPGPQKSMQDLLDNGTVSPELYRFLQAIVQGRANVLILGGTSSGKTTLLNAMADMAPWGERIVTCEQSLELRLRPTGPSGEQRHWVRLRTREANLEGKGEISLLSLIISTLRMNPDRIIIGEVRSKEALAMVKAANTGHDGLLTTAHANNPRDGLERVHLMCREADSGLSEVVVYQSLAAAFQVIIQCDEVDDANGNPVRRVTEVTELVGYDPERRGLGGFTLQPIFRRQDEGLHRVGNISEALARRLRRRSVPDVAYWQGEES